MMTPSAEVHPASMGPHSDECGIRVLRSLPERVQRLQWGRTLMSAESREIVGRILSRLLRASMGPHSDECGIVDHVNPLTPPKKWLQWGLTLMSAESWMPMFRGR